MGFYTENPVDLTTDREKQTIKINHECYMAITTTVFMLQ